MDLWKPESERSGEAIGYQGMAFRLLVGGEPTRSDEICIRNFLDNNLLLPEWICQDKDIKKRALHSDLREDLMKSLCNYITYSNHLTQGKIEELWEIYRNNKLIKSIFEAIYEIDDDNIKAIVTAIFQEKKMLMISENIEKTSSFFKEKMKERNAAQPITIQLTSELPLEMQYIPAGTFTMGSQIIERWDDYPFDKYERTHRVTITKPFFLGKYLVTREQWQAVMGWIPKTEEATEGKPDRYFRSNKHPVTRLDIDKIWEFCNRLSI